MKIRIFCGEKKHGEEDSDVTSFAQLKSLASRVVENPKVALSRASATIADVQVEVVSDMTLKGSIAMAAEQHVPLMLNLHFPENAFPSSVKKDSAAVTGQGAFAFTDSTYGMIANFSFNPPTITVVGNVEKDMLQRIEDRIMKDCVDDANRSAFRGKLPTFELVENYAHRFPVHSMKLGKMSFGDAMQSLMLFTVVDAITGTGVWRVVPGDGGVEVEETIFESHKKLQHVALAGTNKPMKGNNNFRWTFEMFFVRYAS